MKKLIAIIAMALSLPVLADCQFGDQIIRLGEQYNIRDPHLVERATQHYLNEGASPEEARNLAMTSDWTVVAVECTRRFEINPDYDPKTSSYAGEQFLYVGDVLVAGEFQRDFLPEVMGLFEEDKE